MTIASLGNLRPMLLKGVALALVTTMAHAAPASA
ncbi:MAG: hypothetical protein JWL69_2064, partial [Phycisphaerales bacterium]|nr:hypothetical protein [Phycisphaerales bacterium]